MNKVSNFYFFDYLYMEWFEKFDNENIVTIVSVFEDKFKILEAKIGQNKLKIQKYFSTDNLEYKIENIYNEHYQKNISDVLNRILLEKNFKLDNLISFIPEELVFKKFSNVGKSKKFIDIDNEIKITSLRKIFSNLNDISFDYALFEDKGNDKNLNVLLLAIKNQEKNIVENIFNNLNASNLNVDLKRLDTNYFAYRNILKFSYPSFFEDNFLLIDDDEDKLKFFVSYKNFPFYFFTEKKKALIKDKNNILDTDILRIRNYIENKIVELKNVIGGDDDNKLKESFLSINKIYISDDFSDANKIKNLIESIFNKECDICNLYSKIKMDEETKEKKKEFLSLLGICLTKKRDFFKGDVKIW